MKLTPRTAFVVALSVGVAARILLVAFPVAATDVTYYNSQAVSYLLGGVNPYGAAYSVPTRLATPGAADVFAYLPGVFAFLIPGRKAALVACDVAVAVALYLLPSKNRALWASAFLLFPPFVLFSTSFPNDILPAIAFLAAAVALETRRSHLPASLLWGVAFASSQAAWFVFPFYAAYSLRRKKAAPLLVSLLVAAAVVLPFFAWDPGAFVHDAFLFQLGRPAAPLVSPGPFSVNVNLSLQGILASFGASAPLLLRVGAAIVLLVAMLWRSDDSLPALVLRGGAFTVAALWLLSSDFFWSYLELPAVFLLGWAALREGSRLKEPPPA